MFVTSRALASVSASMGIEAPASTNGDAEMGDASEEASVLPENVKQQIDETYETLSATRKKRKAPTGYIKPDDVKKFTAKHTIPSLHSSSPAGITALALSQNNPSHFLTGGNDKIVQLYDRKADKVLATLKGHTKKITHVAFREATDEPTLLLSASADKTVRGWALDETSGEYRPKGSIRAHKGELTGLAVHPTNTILALSSAERTYSLHDLSTFSQIYCSPAAEEPYTAMTMHPDGTLLAFGTPTSTVQIFDIRSGALAGTLIPEGVSPFTVNTLSISENGYHLLAPSSLSSVAIWDLRKLSVAESIDLGESFKVNKVLYDFSANLLGVAGNEGLRVLKHKTWDELIRFEEGGEVLDFVFGPQGREIWGASGREVRIWGASK